MLIFLGCKILQKILLQHSLHVSTVRPPQKILIISTSVLLLFAFRQSSARFPAARATPVRTQVSGATPELIDYRRVRDLSIRVNQMFSRSGRSSLPSKHRTSLKAALVASAFARNGAKNSARREFTPWQRSEDQQRGRKPIGTLALVEKQKLWATS